MKLKNYFEKLEEDVLARIAKSLNVKTTDPKKLLAVVKKKRAEASKKGDASGQFVYKKMQQDLEKELKEESSDS